MATNHLVRQLSDKYDEDVELLRSENAKLRSTLNGSVDRASQGWKEVVKVNEELEALRDENANLRKQVHGSDLAAMNHATVPDAGCFETRGGKGENGKTDKTFTNTKSKTAPLPPIANPIEPLVPVALPGALPIADADSEALMDGIVPVCEETACSKEGQKELGHPTPTRISGLRRRRHKLRTWLPATVQQVKVRWLSMHATSS
jgi:hypothetical protein